MQKPQLVQGFFVAFITGADSELHPLRKATVDHHVSAGRKRRAGAGQKRHGIGDFIVGTHSAHRDTGDRRIVEIRHVSLDLLPGAALEKDRARAHRIDPNARRRQCLR